MNGVIIKLNYDYIYIIVDDYDSPGTFTGVNSACASISKKTESRLSFFFDDTPVRDLSVRAVVYISKTLKM